MILLIHHHGKRVLHTYRDGDAITCINRLPALALLELAENYPDEIITWCDARYKTGINGIKWTEIIENRSIMASYSCSGRVFLPEAIGLVDTSLFAKINWDVTYPTWFMSGDRGGMHAQTLLAFKELEIPVDQFDYFLSSIAKQGMPHGLLTYSDVRLGGTSRPKSIKYSNDNGLLYDFVKSHYRTRWLFLLFLQQLIYQQKAPFLTLIMSVFKAKTPDFQNSSLSLSLSGSGSSSSSENNKNNSSNKNNCNSNNNSLDVLIPTVGRKKYLYDVLSDLRNQTVLPRKVIIVEQNPQPDSKTELDYLTTEKWPFEIKHIFTHKTGACNARNLGLEEVTADWVFLADDDIRIPEDFIADSFSFIETGKARAFTVSCLREGEREPTQHVLQWRTFGSGCSFVKSDCLKDVRFDLAFEGGFGEDADFGMQLRNKGVDVLYNPFLKLIHLKAPVGGFRYKSVKPWEDEEFPPKPAPTVMVYQLKHATNLQLCGYKTILFLKFFRRQADKNPFTYFRSMQKRWRTSIKWALYLLQ